MLAAPAQYQPPASAPNQTQPTQAATAGESPYLEGGTFVVSTAAGGIAVPDPSQPPRTLSTYRGDTRPPDLIFKEGFQPRAPNSPVSLYDYARNNTPSAFVGTSESKTVAKGFAFNPASGQPKKETYIYAVRLSKGVDVNLALGQTSPFPHEREVAVQGGISSSSIKGAWHYRRNSVTGHLTRGQFIKNPHFGKSGGK
jgi:hypothetical protein